MKMYMYMIKKTTPIPTYLYIVYLRTHIISNEFYVNVLYYIDKFVRFCIEMYCTFE